MRRMISWLFFVALLHSSAQALTVAGRDAQIKTIGSPTTNAWGLWAIGEVGSYIDIPVATTYTVTVDAFGGVQDNEWPAMTVFVDYEPVAETFVTTATATTFTFTLPIDAGAHRLTFGLANGDASLKLKKRRTLFIRSFSITGPHRSHSTPTLIDEARWRATAEITLAKREQHTLADAEARIERVRKTDVTLHITDAAGQPIRGAKATLTQTRQAFLFGNNFYMFRRCPSPEANTLYEKYFLDLMNYATIAFYWRSYEQTRGQVDYSYTDAVVQWCRERNIPMKGHPLLWGDEGGIPVWSNNVHPTPDEQKRRITEIMHRYAGKITAWEIVNEPAHFPNLPFDDPYRWGRSADPTATLILNDYQAMADGYLPFFTLLQQAIDKKIPFDAIGIQAHEPRFARFSLPAIQRNLDRYATLGKPLHITEFIASSGGQKMERTPIQAVWNEDTQADYVTKFYTMCFAHPAVVGITWWDLSDAASWLPGGGLLRSDFSPKPAYNALKALIRDKWMTRTTGTSDARGAVTFRGFLGDYTVVVEHNGQRIETTLSVTRDNKGITGTTIVLPTP